MFTFLNGNAETNIMAKPNIITLLTVAINVLQLFQSFHSSSLSHSFSTCHVGANTVDLPIHSLHEEIFVIKICNEKSCVQEFTLSRDAVCLQFHAKMWIWHFGWLLENLITKWKSLPSKSFYFNNIYKECKHYEILTNNLVARKRTSFWKAIGSS